MVMAAALSGCMSAHARWQAWRWGGSAALRCLGLPVCWLAWCGRWLCESVANHYGDAPDDFVVADNVELPWPPALEVWNWSGHSCPSGTSFRRSSWLYTSRKDILDPRRSLADGRTEKEAPRLRAMLRQSGVTGRAALAGMWCGRS